MSLACRPCPNGPDFLFASRPSQPVTLWLLNVDYILWSAGATVSWAIKQIATWSRIPSEVVSGLPVLHMELLVDAPAVQSKSA